MMNKLPTYYRNSKVMQSIMESLDKEMERLQKETTLTENQFFVLLADRDIASHEKDVGLSSSPSLDIDSRRARVLSRLRGTGTVSKTMLKNVAKSFINGDIEITEYPSEYLFSVTFTSRQGVPYNLQDIQDAIDEIKPAHLAVEYIFTYRLWQDIKDLFLWTEANRYTWDGLLSLTVPARINIVNNKPYFCPDETGNGYVVWIENKAYARRI